MPTADLSAPSAESEDCWHARISPSAPGVYRNTLKVRLHDYMSSLGTSSATTWKPLGAWAGQLGMTLHSLHAGIPCSSSLIPYEEIDEGNKLLQMIMGAAGGRVGWVIAGRDNLWAGVGQRRRSLEVEYGYRDLVLPDRRMVIDFSADGVGDFTSSDIEEYFIQLSRKALRPALPAVSEKDAVHIRDVTEGVPLAVKIAAGLYLESQDLALIMESLDGKREIVDQMVERYLLHTRTNPADRSRLYGLALLRRPDEQRALAAALDVPDNYDAELTRLHRRYGFIFTRQEQPALHQEVRYFLRLWLLQHRTSSPEIMGVISRLREAHFSSFQELEAQRHYASLRERLEDEQWIGLYLDLTEQQFWLDPAEGVASVLPFMFAASVYQREANRVARTIGEFFQATLVQPYRKQWDWANQSLVYSTSRNPLPEELSGLKDVVRLASQNRVAFFPPVPPFQEELEAAVWWRLGEAYHGKSSNKCVYWYEKALGRLLHEEDLREALTEAKSDREHTVTEEEADEDDLLQQTAPKLPGGTPDSGAGGTTTSDSQRTMAELDRALERDPKSVRAYTQRGDAYTAHKEYRRAITDFDRALELAPQDASLYAKRGEAYLLLREYRQAITDFDRALELAPQDASLYAKRGEAYLLLREYRRALVDFDRTLELEPGNETIRTKRNEASLELTRPQQTPVPPRVSPKPAWSSPVNGRSILLIGLALLVIVASGVGLFSVIHANQIATDHANATATAANATGTTTAHIDAVTATAQATAAASVIAANPNPYPPGVGTLALYDPLRDNSLGYGWREGTISSGEDCKFTGGAYHVTEPQLATFNYCQANSTNFSNFAYEVQMKIIRGDGGGIIFRANTTNSNLYVFYVNQTGSYGISLCRSGFCQALIARIFSPAIKQGLNQTNIIAVVAQGNTMTFYVNHQQATSVPDSTYSHGQIGMIAAPYITGGGLTEVAYSNAKVWTF